MGVKASALWLGCYWLERVQKCNDFVKRLLMDNINTGTRLTWIGQDEQIWPICKKEQTIEHFLLKCDVVRSMWLKAREIYRKPASRALDFEFMSRTLNQLKG